MGHSLVRLLVRSIAHSFFWFHCAHSFSPSLSLSLASKLIGYCEVKCPIFKLFCTIVRWALSGGSHARNMRKNANDENALPITEGPSDPTINRPNNQPTNRPNNQPTNQTERSIDQPTSLLSERPTNLLTEFTAACARRRGLPFRDSANRRH